MQNKIQKNKDFSIFYIIFVAADFFTSIFNLIKRLFYEDFSAPELFMSLTKTVYFRLPLIAFIILSRKAAETDDMEKRLKIKRVVAIYITACFLLGIIERIIENHWDIHLPMFPFGLFYSYSWMLNITYIIKYHIYSLILPLIYDVSFLVISIMFIKSLNKNMSPEEKFKEGIGKTSTGFKLGIAGAIILSIQTAFNISIAGTMHDNLSDVSGEHALGAAVLALILIAVKLFVDLILLPALPLSIAGLIKCNSKTEKDQDRKNRLIGKKINIVCLVIAAAELVFIW